MKTFFAVTGFVFWLLFAIGSVNVIDFHVCAKAPGECSK
jgi:hypothetical protein